MTETTSSTPSTHHTRLTRKIGPYTTTAIGLGGMGLSIEKKPSREVAIQVIHDALDAGCRHLDTAWAYYMSGGEEQHNEKLIREALDTWHGPKDEVLVATKSGHFRNFTDGVPTWDVNGAPEALIQYGKQSAQALGVEAIDLLYFHRPDPKVPYNESIEGMKVLYDEGVAKTIGISNASVEQIDIARSILGDALVAVQNQLSPIYTDSLDTVEYTKKLGLTFVSWSPLGGFRKPKDESKYDPFKEVAAHHGVSYQQVVLAWELAMGDHMMVLPGAHRSETILDSLRADELVLSQEEIDLLNR
ncbi:aldo/keto reductase [Alloscardovia macacae]|uniref:Oxidoreductase, aldo/keto reductase family protein n=1 Tax=Alloscardovia macacae TaxID=1160091 RepID=A0A261F4Q3_9BIFI|nr:aldo/keto reductase [Alloscardovia macacae]OZG54084.1 oxidoreductase, aldo/keto reductase family protein [Alloscardovia macacae]